MGQSKTKLLTHSFDMSCPIPKELHSSNLSITKYEVIHILYKIFSTNKSLKDYSNMNQLTRVIFVNITFSLKDMRPNHKSLFSKLLVI